MSIKHKKNIEYNLAQRERDFEEDEGEEEEEVKKDGRNNSVQKASTMSEA